MKIFSRLSICLKTSQNASHCVYTLIAVWWLRYLSENEVLLKWVTWSRSTTEFHRWEFQKKLKSQAASQASLFQISSGYLIESTYHKPQHNIHFSISKYHHLLIWKPKQDLCSDRKDAQLCFTILVFKVWVKLFLWQQYNKKWKPTRNDTRSVQMCTEEFKPREWKQICQ